jgi:PAS domain S-box-containing protein
MQRSSDMHEPLRSDLEAFYRLADSAKVLIWTSGPDKLCDWFNHTWLEFTGRTMEQELGNGWTDGVHPDDLSRCLTIYTAAFDSRQEFSMEYRLRRHDGVYRRVLDIGAPYFSANGKFRGYFGSCIDVTEAKRGEGALQAAQSKLARIRAVAAIGAKASAFRRPEYEAGTSPTGAEIRAALERMVASDMFRTSPQLAAFLRFVVEATLRGEGTQIKGHTIAVEALGRGENFDPQQDPIVRVEAGRLRRTMEQYYAGPGAIDLVVIDLPLGRYIPTFHYRVAEEAIPSLPEGRSLAAGALRAWRGSLGSIPRAWRVWCLPVAVLVLIGIAVMLAIGRWDRATELAITAPVPTDRQLMSAFRAGNGFPVVSVHPFEATGMPAVSRIALEGLHRKLTNALARFDEITVALAATTFAGAGVQAPDKYDLGMTAEDRGDGTVSLTFRLIDASDNTLVWLRAFDRTQFARNPGADEERVAGEVASTLARTFGIIHSREWGKVDKDPRYACVLKTLDYLRGLDAGEYAQARACLERVTGLDPNFAVGFAWLSLMYIREHQYEGLGHPDDPPALDRALKAAQRAVALKPQSARAHEALLGAYFARGEFGAAFAEGDTALSLNPFDPATRTVYGIRLIAVGQYDRGAALLKDTSANSVQRPTWLNSYLLLAAYLKGDLATAAQYANLDTSETHPLNLVARALLAGRNGDQGRAREIMDRLGSLYPSWRDSPRRELQKFIPSTEIVDRLTNDLAAAGRGVGN